MHRESFPFPEVATYAIGALELAGGAALVAGLLVRPFALALAGNMVGTVHMVMPLGELKLQLVSPPLRGGAR